MSPEAMGIVMGPPSNRFHLPSQQPRTGQGPFSRMRKSSFADNGVDVALLPELTNDDLKDLGVTRLADRKRLLKAITGQFEGDGQTRTIPSQPAAPVGERRQVTILFADLSGFTELSSVLDAEELHGVVSRFFAVADGAIENYGGTVDKHMGDAVMALFGAPVAHGDDPLRAVRAAFDIHGAMEALSAELGRELRVHVGIASGEVVAGGLGSAQSREYTVLGDSVNRYRDPNDRDRRSIGELLDGRLPDRTVIEISSGGYDLKMFAIVARFLAAQEKRPAAEPTGRGGRDLSELLVIRQTAERCEAR